jgi:hypothetical protein
LVGKRRGPLGMESTGFEINGFAGFWSNLTDTVQGKDRSFLLKLLKYHCRWIVENEIDSPT